MKKKVFIVGYLLLCWIGLIATPSTIQSDSVTLSTLPDLIEKFVAASPGKLHVDGALMVRAHRKFVDILDPEKTYFLESEMAPFIDENKSAVFLEECVQGSFSSYKQLVFVFQRAIERTRRMRRHMSAAQSQLVATKDFPKNEEELERKVSVLFFPSQGERKGALSKQVVADLEKREQNWMLFTDEFLAQHILKSILSCLDVNSDVLGKREARNMREKLTKEAYGTGIVCEMTNDAVRIASVQKGSPAEKLALFCKGDVIVSIDGESCVTMTLEEVDERLREKRKGGVFLRCQRKDVFFEQHVPSRFFVLGDERVQGEKHRDILVLSVPSFYVGEQSKVSTSKDISAILKKEGAVSGIILDVRKNGGGYLAEAVNTCGLFLKTGVVMTALYADGGIKVYRDTDPRVLFDGPIVIMTSEWTASAAEIVTQALKDYGKAIIVGSSKTFGKGSIQLQTVTDIKAIGSLPLRYTVGKFYSVSGLSPDGRGIEPDIVLPGMYGTRCNPSLGEALPESIPDRFQDTLDDIASSLRNMYRKNYIPYLQKREVAYRKHIPVLQKKSKARIDRLFSQTLPSQNAENIETFQLQEAENILEDLLIHLYTNHE